MGKINFPPFFYFLNTKSTLVNKPVSPELKYYAFDWDDNIVHMPTKIILLDINGKEVLMSTKDFANYRTDIGINQFLFEGHVVCNYAPRPFRYFGSEGNTKFLFDSSVAELGPAWNDYKEAINNGSIFAIITARGHSPEIIKEAVLNHIENNFAGISKDLLLKNLKKYRAIVCTKLQSDSQLIASYLDLNRYCPVSYMVTEDAATPEEAKVIAMASFVKYVKNMAISMQKTAYLKNGISNKFIPKKVSIGFSDDDEINVLSIKNYFESINQKINLYSTKGGIKKKL